MSVPSPALLDTSVVIDLDGMPIGALPKEQAIRAITLAQLARVRTGRRMSTSRPDARTASNGSRHSWNRCPSMRMQLAHTAASMQRPVQQAGIRAEPELSTSLPLTTHNPSDFAHLAAIGLQVHAISPRASTVCFGRRRDGPRRSATRHLPGRRGVHGDNTTWKRPARSILRVRVAVVEPRPRGRRNTVDDHHLCSRRWAAAATSASAWSRRVWSRPRRSENSGSSITPAS